MNRVADFVRNESHVAVNCRFNKAGQSMRRDVWTSRKRCSAQLILYNSRLYRRQATRRRFVTTLCAMHRRRNFRDCFETKVNLIYRLIIARAKFRIKLVIGFRLIRRNCTEPRRTWPVSETFRP